MLPLVQRKGAQSMRDELMAREMYARPQFPGPGMEPVHSVGPGQWTRRMAELESDVRALKAENERLKRLEAEREALKCQVRTQDDLISLLQGAQGNHAALVDKSAIPGPTSVPGLEAAKRLGLPPPPEALKEALAQMGNGPLMMMMSMMSGALQEGLARAEAEAQAPKDAAALLQGLAASTPRKTERDTDTDTPVAKKAKV